MHQNGQVSVSDIEAVNRYWDTLVAMNRPSVVPEPTPPTELTSLIHRMHVAERSSAVQTARSDRRLQLLLDKQQELIKMNSSLENLSLTTTASMQIPFAPRQYPNRRFGWAAVVALLVCGALLLSQWYRFENGVDPNPGLVAPTAVASPGTASPTPVTTNLGVTLVWRAGQGKESMLYPTDVAIGPDGNISVADSAHNQIRVFSPDGELIETWGEAGSGPGQFNFLRDKYSQDESLASLTYDADGNLYVVDTANFRIQKFDAAHNFLLEWGSRGGGPGQFSEPCSIAISSDGIVYVQDFRRDLIQMFDTTGKYLGRLGKRGIGAVQFNDTGWISVDQSGTIWSADWGNDRVMAINPDGSLKTGWGEFGTEPGQFTEVIDAVSDSNGHVYTAEMGAERIQVFDESGHLLTIIEDKGDNGFMVPGALAVDSDGNLYVADFGRGQLLKFQVDFSALTPAPSVLGRMTSSDPAAPATSGVPGSNAQFLWSTADAGQEYGAMTSMTVAPDGTIWMVDAGKDAIQIFGADGTYIEQWGSAGSGPGQFDFVEDRMSFDLYSRVGQVLFLSDGGFVVSDPGNGRVQRFDSNRKFLFEFGNGTGSEANPEATIESIGQLLDLGNGHIGVTDLPASTGASVDMVEFDQAGMFVKRIGLVGVYPIVTQGSDGYWSLTIADDASYVISYVGWDGIEKSDIT